MNTLTQPEKNFIIEIIDAAYQAGLIRGNVKAQTQAIQMTHSIIQKLRAGLPTNGEVPQQQPDSLPAELVEPR